MMKIRHEALRTALIFAAVMSCLVAFLGPGYAQDRAQTFYHTRFFLSGFLLRSSSVCGGDWQRTAADAIDLIATSELETISNAYPETVKSWGMEGANNFNTGVMTSGLGAACAEALKIRQKAEELAEIKNSPRLNNPEARSSQPNVRPSLNEVPNGTAAIEVPLKSEGGTFLVPVLINGQITLSFTIDSGASDVTIPADVVSTLIRTGSIKDTDFTGQQSYKLADGTVMPSVTFIIRSLKVGDRILEDIHASVAPANGSLLLGQSFLTRFRSWSIDNKRQVLLLN
jgi:clan AA aspartic protease (TIGR02281 family)